MMRISIFLAMLLIAASGYAQKTKKPNIVFKYKKYEKFDFENMSVSGDSTDPGDLSVGPRFRKRFRNELPERKNFNKEIYKSLKSIK